jgi:sporulation protein YlmC with PRC-barrel domain
MKFLLLTTIAGLALSPIAYAQDVNAPSTNMPNASTANSSGQKNESVRQHIQDSLQKAGFTDIEIRPEAFLIDAKDKSGNPVAISVTPNSIDEVSYQDTTGSTQRAPQDSQNSGGIFTSVQPEDKLSSNLVGLTVYNNDNQDIGVIKDISVDQKGVRAFILGVGGFLGMAADRYVAVTPSAVKVSYSDSDKKWHATLNASADQLKSAPEFKYSGPWKASKM